MACNVGGTERSIRIVLGILMIGVGTFVVGAVASAFCRIFPPSFRSNEQNKRVCASPISSSANGWCVEMREYGRSMDRGTNAVCHVRTIAVA